MAIYITEHPLPRIFTGNPLPVVELPPLATQRVVNGAVSVQSSVFNAATRMIGVHTDAIVSIAVGANPTATTSDKRMAANTTEYFFVEAGQRLAVINNT
jgi:hypothetical protein